MAKYRLQVLNFIGNCSHKVKERHSNCMCVVRRFLLVISRLTACQCTNVLVIANRYKTKQHYNESLLSAYGISKTGGTIIMTSRDSI